MDFTAIPSALVRADYLTFEELRDEVGGSAGAPRARQIFPADLLGGHLIVSDTGAALPI